MVVFITPNKNQRNFCLRIALKTDTKPNPITSNTPSQSKKNSIGKMISIMSTLPVNALILLNLHPCMELVIKRRAEYFSIRYGWLWCFLAHHFPCDVVHTILTLYYRLDSYASARMASPIWDRIKLNDWGAFVGNNMPYWTSDLFDVLWTDVEGLTCTVYTPIRVVMASTTLNLLGECTLQKKSHQKGFRIHSYTKGFVNIIGKGGKFVQSTSKIDLRAGSWYQVDCEGIVRYKGRLCHKCKTMHTEKCYDGFGQNSCIMSRKYGVL
jgi:hypothetical protein